MRRTASWSARRLAAPSATATPHGARTHSHVPLHTCALIRSHRQPWSRLLSPLPSVACTCGRSTAFELNSNSQQRCEIHRAAVDLAGECYGGRKGRCSIKRCVRLPVMATSCLRGSKHAHTLHTTCTGSHPTTPSPCYTQHEHEADVQHNDARNRTGARASQRPSGSARGDASSSRAAAVPSHASAVPLARPSLHARPKAARGASHARSATRRVAGRSVASTSAVATARTRHRGATTAGPRATTAGAALSPRGMPRSLLLLARSVGSKERRKRIATPSARRRARRASVPPAKAANGPARARRTRRAAWRRRRACGRAPRARRPTGAT